MTTISSRIADELERQGVRAVFTLMSEETAKLIVEVDRRGIPLYSTRHDSTPVGMADGYARASGDVGVAVVGRGPGLTNALNPLVTAAKAGTGMVVLVGDAPLDPAAAARARGERMGKHIDQAATLDAVGVTNITLRSPETAIRELAECFDRARGGGVVTVNLPTDLLEAVTASAGADLPPAAPPRVAIEPPEDEIRLVADLLEESWAARHPVILAGYGAVASEAHDDLSRLGEITGALMSTTLLGNSLFRSDPFNIGIIGTLATPLASELVSQADLVLVFGASLNQYTTYRGDLLRGARVIQFDQSRSASGRYLEVELAIVADARLGAAALVRELERRGHRSSGYRTPEVAARIEELSLDTTVTDRGDSTGLDPRTVMIELDRMLPAERTLIVDGGHHFEFSMAHIAVPDPRGFVFANDYFSVGTGLAAALGAAVARPDRMAVLVIGDGGLMLNLGDLDTAVRYRLPMLIVVVNDGGFGSEIHYLRVNGLPDKTARYENPSFAAVAAGLGARGITLESMDQVGQLRAAIKSLDGPLVVDVKVTTEVRANWVDFLFSKAAVAPR